MEKEFDYELHVIIVDDEYLAREKLKGLLKEYRHVRVMEEACDICEAEKKIIEKRPDLIFLDIQMPGGTGFDLLERLEDPPRVIFVTAFDQFAIRAFKVNALDYLLKPIDAKRLEDSLKRAAATTGLPEDAGGLLSMTDQVFLNTGKKKLFLPVANIAAINTEGNYTNVIDLKGEHFMIRASLKDWERRLPKDVFVVLGRTLLINRRQVRSWTMRLRGIELCMADVPTFFLLGRAGYQRFRELVVSAPVKKSSERP